MKTIVVNIPENAVNEIQRAGFEVDSRRGVVDRYMDKHMNDADEFAINAKPFVYFMSLLTEAEAHFEMAKAEIEKEYVPEFLKGHQYEWSLDYASARLTINVMCDCDIPELNDWQE